MNLLRFQKINQLQRMNQLFFILASKNELKSLLNTMEKLDSFSAQKEFAEENFKHLSSGSSRLVYSYSDKIVIKLAKNEKGLAQNKAEANPKMKSKFLNKILDHAKDFSWIKTCLLEKIDAADFEKMT